MIKYSKTSSKNTLLWDHVLKYQPLIAASVSSVPVVEDGGGSSGGGGGWGLKQEG